MMANRKFSTTLICLTTLILLSQAPASLAWNDCDVSREIDRRVDVTGAKFLTVSAGAGSLKIVGEQGRDDIQIIAKLCSSSQSVLDEMNVATERTSSGLELQTVFPNQSFWRGDESASIDLTLLVPAEFELDVADSSGEASVAKVAKLSMVDSSGRLEISDIAGDLRVVDSSGELTIRNVNGDVNLRDSSGGIYVQDIAGSLVIEVDSSGGIEANNIGKNVLVKLDSSGSIEVRDVGGDFTVEKDSSGGVTHERVRGKVRI